MTARMWRHNDLADDLARHLRGGADRLVWTDMQLGPAGSPRPDVYTLPKTYSRFTPLAYEVKVSTADFRRDVTAGKWQSYLEFSAGVVFAAPAGLITKADVLPGCGLIVRHEQVWRTVKGPTLKHVATLPHAAWMKLMIDGLPRAVFAGTPEPRSLKPWNVEAEVRRKYGQKLAALLSDLSLAESRLMVEIAKAKVSAKTLREAERTREQAARAIVEKEMAGIRKDRADLCAALGLDADADIWTVRTACQEAAKRLAGDGELQRLRRQLEWAQQALTKGLEELPAIARVA